MLIVRFLSLLLLATSLNAAHAGPSKHTPESLGLAVANFPLPLWAQVMAYVGTSNIIQRGNTIDITAIVQEKSVFKKPLGITKIVLGEAGDFMTINLVLWGNTSIPYSIEGSQETWKRGPAIFDHRPNLEWLTQIPQARPDYFSFSQKFYAYVCNHDPSIGGKQVRVLQRKPCPTYNALMGALNLSNKKDIEYENDIPLDQLLIASAETKENSAVANRDLLAHG